EQIPSLENLRSGEAAPASSAYCAAVADAQLNIDRYLQAVQVKPVEKLELSGDALFDSGSAVIKQASLVRLQSIVEQLRSQAGELKAVKIVGHTDNTGSAELNRELSLARAMAV